MSLESSIASRKLLSFFIIMLLVSPSASLFIGRGDGAGSASDGNGSRAPGDVAHVWPQFQRNELHTGDYLEGIRGIDDPIIQWDNKDKFETELHSYSVTAGDLESNIEVEGGKKYDRNVEHVAYAGQYSGDNETVFIVDGQSGESMWEMTLDESVDIETSIVIGNINGDAEQEIVFADTDGNVYAYQPQIVYERNRPKNDRYSWQDFNDEADLVWKYETGHSISETSLLLVDVNEDGKQDVVFGHVDTNSNTGYITALDGSDRSGSGDRLWRVELDHGTTQIVSTPALVEFRSESRYIWVTAFGTESSGGEDRLWVYRIKADNGQVFNTVDLVADRGSSNLGLPAPVVYDIDGDDQQSPDIIVCVPQDPDNDDSEQGSIYIFDRNMERHKDWRTGIPAEGRIDATPVVGKLHKNHDVIIVVQSWLRTGTLNYATTYLEAFSADARRIWHRSHDTDAEDLMDDRATASPTLFDIDGNGFLDVVSATTPTIFAMNGTDGDPMDGFPFSLAAEDENDEHAFLTSMAVGDMDRDNIFDIVIDGLMLTHRIPDLLITDVDLMAEEERPKHGETIDIEATVRNNGTTGAYNVNISFFMDGEYIGKDSIGVERDRSETATISWTATEGHHKLVVAADPEDLKEEANETNNNFTREFDILSPYGVNIYYNETFQKADPGDEASFKIGIENNGTEEDNMSVEFSDYPGEWIVNPYGVGTGDKVNLRSEEEKNITIGITTPDDARSGEQLEVTVWVNTSQGGKSRNVTLTVEVNQVHEVDLNFVSESSQKVTPGESVYYTIEIVNTGNGVDTFVVTTEDVPSDWRAFIKGESSEEFSLGIGQKTEFDVRVRAPAINDIENTKAEITVRAESKHDSSADSEVLTISTISSIMVSENGQEVEPAATYHYPIVIYNLGDVRDTIELSTYLKTAEPGWHHELDKTSVVLDAKEKGNATLSVTVAEDAKPGTKEVIELRARFENQTQYDDETDAITFAKQLYKVEIEACQYARNSTNLETQDNKAPFRSNEEIDFRLRVTNKGNGVDNITLEIQGLPASWSYLVYPEKRALQPFGENGDTGFIYVNITSYGKARAFQSYDISLVVQSEGEPSKKDSYPLHIHVKQTKGFELSVDVESKTVKPSNYVSYNVTFQNEGNWYDKVEIKVINGPLEGWAAAWNNESSDFNLSLSPHQFITYQLIFSCPDVFHPNARAGTVDTTRLWTELNSTKQKKSMDLSTDVEQVYLGDLVINTTGTIIPSGMLSYHGNFTNVGNGEEEVQFRSTFFYNGKQKTKLDGWAFTLRDLASQDIEEVDVTLLEVNESFEFYLNVSAPPMEHENAEAGFLASVFLLFYQKFDPDTGVVIQERFVNTTMDQIFDIEVKANVLERSVVPEETVNFYLTLTNHGNGVDTVAIDPTITVPEGYDSDAEDWTLEFDDDELTLGRGDRDTVNITLSPPGFNKAEQGVVANITLRFLSDAGAVDNNLSLSLYGKLAQMMVEGPRERKVVPYKGMNFTLIFARLKNSPSEDFNLKDLEQQNTIPRDWIVDYYALDSSSKETKVVMDKKPDKEVIRFWVMPRTTEHARFNDSHSFKLQVNNGGLVDDETVLVTVDHYYKFFANITDSTMAGNPGKTVTFDGYIQNRGNIEDGIRDEDKDVFFLSVDTVDAEGNSWGLEFRDAEMLDEERAYVALGYEEDTTFTVKMTIPEEALAGETNFTLLIESEADQSVFMMLNLSITVGERRDVSIIVLDAAKSSQDDEDVSFEIVARNLGNTEDRFRFETTIDEARYFGFEGFNQTYVTLQPDEHVQVLYTVHVKEDTPENTYMITLLVRSQDEPSVVNTTVVNIDVTPRPKPDLTISDLSFDPFEPEDGDDVTIHITIKNQGSGNAGEFEVSLEIDGKNVKVFKDISSLDSGSSIRRDYTTSLSAGTYDVRVLADTGSDVSESDEDNNDDEIEITVSETGDGGGGYFIPVLIMLVLALTGGFFFISRTRQQPGTRKKKPVKKSPVPSAAAKKKIAKKEVREQREDLPSEDEEMGYGDDDGGTVRTRGPEDHDDEDEGESFVGTKDQISISGEKRAKVKEEKAGSVFPVITPCPFCHVKIKIPKDGKFRCPQCEKIGFMDEKGEAKEPASFPMIIQCPECNDKIKVPSHGKFRCPKCQAVSEIDAAGNIKGKKAEFPLAIVCPFCEAKLKVSRPGKFRCSKCKGIARIDVEGKITPVTEEEHEEEEETEREEERNVAAREGIQMKPRVTRFPLLKICPSCSESTKIPRPGWSKCEHCSYVMEIDGKGDFVSKYLKDSDRSVRDYHESEDMLALREEIGGIKETVQERQAREQAEIMRRRRELAARKRRELEARRRRELVQRRQEEDQEGPEAPSDEDTGGEEGYEEEEEWQEAEFPLVIECRSCEKKVRVKSAGKFRCPGCKEIDQIDEYGQFADEEEDYEGYYDEEEQEEEQEPAEFPLIIECRYCEKKMRVREAGKFKCPNCSEIDQIDEYGQFVEE